jgi:putative flippase GtrA
MSSDGAKVPHRSVVLSTRRWAATHPAPRFVVVGGLGAALDVGLLRLLYGSVHVPLLLATALAYAAAAVPVFFFNRQWSFSTSRDGAVHRQFLRYVSLIVLNLLSTVAMVGVLHWAGVFYLLAKIIAIAVNSIANFFGYKHWVFT